VFQHRWEVRLEEDEIHARKSWDTTERVTLRVAWQVKGHIKRRVSDWGMGETSTWRRGM
jgi:hypothetical protein